MSALLAALLTTARKWNQPWCPLMDEGNVAYVYTQGISIIHKEGVLLYAATWTELEDKRNKPHKTITICFQLHVEVKRLKLKL